MKTGLFMLSIGLAALVSGCGGGGESGVVVAPTAGGTPTPSPSPTSSPTPTPTGSGPTLLNFSGTQQFNSYHTILLYKKSSAGMLSAFQMFEPSASVGLIFDGPSAKYFYYFAASNLPPHDTAATNVSIRFDSSGRDGAFTTYSATDNGATYALRTLTPGPTNPQLSLSYLSLGTAEGMLTDTNTATVTIDYRPFAYGFFAEREAVPTNGTARYNGIVVGRAASATGSNVYSITGTIALDTDYTAGTFSGSVTLSGTDTRDGSKVSFGTFQIVDNVPYARPLNMIGGYIGSGRDQFRGGLGGSSAEEFAGTFALTVDDPRANGVSMNIVAAAAARR